MDRVITRCNIKGHITACASKSVMHRVLICAALADKPTKIYCNGSSEDIQATIECLRNMSAIIEEVSEEHSNTKIYTVQPISKNISRVLNCRESGSTLRFLISVNAALGADTIFTGRTRLMERPKEELLEELAEHGSTVRQTADSIVITGKLLPGDYHLSGNTSSQFVSGLLMALPLLDSGSNISLMTEPESSAYIDITIDVLRQFGVNIIKSGTREYLINSAKKQDVLVQDLVQEKRQYNSFSSAGEYHIEGDWSNTAFWLVAGAIASPQGLRLSGLDINSAQGDKSIISILKEMGADIDIVNAGTQIGVDLEEMNTGMKISTDIEAVNAGMPIGTDIEVVNAETKIEITVKKSRLRGIDISVKNIPDLVPALAVAAATAQEKTIFRDAARLRLKESDRIEAIVNMINSLGGNAYTEEDNIIIIGTGRLKGGVVNSCNDHRIAMAAAIATLGCTEPVTIIGAEAVGKSYPDFYNILSAHIEKPI